MCCLLCSNVLPMEVDVQRDFVTESSPSALRAIFASWSLEDCKRWCGSLSAGLTFLLGPISLPTLLPRSICIIM